jgi:hypothetical protein
MISRSAIRRIIPNVIERDSLNITGQYPLRVNINEIIPPNISSVSLEDFEDRFFLKGSLPNIKLLCLQGCDKNFVYYNLDNYHFPNLQTVLCFSHPAEYSLQCRLKGVNVITHIPHYFNQLKCFPCYNDEDLLRIMKELKMI